MAMPSARFKTGGEGVRQPFLQVVFLDQAIYNHFDIVLVVLVQLNVVGEFANLAIHPHPHKAFGSQAGEQLFCGCPSCPAPPEPAAGTGCDPAGP